MLDQLLIEKEFGYLEPNIYLNISSVAMPPVRVREVCRSFMDDYVESMGRKVMTDFEGMREETKKKLAQLINANPEEIIFVKNTTEGNSILASGYQKAPGAMWLSVIWSTLPICSPGSMPVPEALKLRR